MTQRITLRTVLEHMQEFKNSLEKKIDQLAVDLQKTKQSLSGQIDGLDQRLDSIEITILEQKHEPRIRRLERHAGFIK